jgi:hypothetical protein
MLIRAKNEETGGGVPRNIVGLVIAVVVIIVVIWLILQVV